MTPLRIAVLAATLLVAPALADEAPPPPQEPPAGDEGAQAPQPDGPGCVAHEPLII